jgi:hypothetical protein
MAFVEMDDAPRISWRDHFHEVEVYVTARRNGWHGSFYFWRILARKVGRSQS